MYAPPAISLSSIPIQSHGAAPKHDGPGQSSKNYADGHEAVKDQHAGIAFKGRRLENRCPNNSGSDSGYSACDGTGKQSNQP
jgi:hypothetical protein